MEGYQREINLINYDIKLKDFRMGKVFPFLPTTKKWMRKTFSVCFDIEVILIELGKGEISLILNTYHFVLFVSLVFSSKRKV